MVNQNKISKKKENKEQNEITLREVFESDLEFFFNFQLDKEANYMAAFTSKDPTDREAFDKHWDRIRSNLDIVNRTILYKNEVVGSIAKFTMENRAEITYWIDKKFWRKGIATEAVRQLLTIVTIRPLYARVAKDNIGSNRVLEKTGFVIIGEDKGYAEGRGKETEEYIRMLN